MTHKCKNCEYEWVSRVDNPRACPKCKVYLDKKSKKK